MDDVIKHRSKVRDSSVRGELSGGQSPDHPVHFDGQCLLAADFVHSARLLCGIRGGRPRHSDRLQSPRLARHVQQPICATINTVIRCPILIN